MIRLTLIIVSFITTFKIYAYEVSADIPLRFFLLKPETSKKTLTVYSLAGLKVHGHKTFTHRLQLGGSYEVNLGQQQIFAQGAQLEAKYSLYGISPVSLDHPSNIQIQWVSSLHIYGISTLYWGTYDLRSIMDTTNPLYRRPGSRLTLEGEMLSYSIGSGLNYPWDSHGWIKTEFLLGYGAISGFALGSLTIVSLTIGAGYQL